MSKNTRIKAAALATLRNIADIVETDHVRGLVALDEFCTRFGALLRISAAPLTDLRCATKEDTYWLISDLGLLIEARFLAK